MRRRVFIALVAGAGAWPLAVPAQQSGGARSIGVLMGLSEDDQQGQHYVATFRDGLRELGWRNGDNVRIEIRWGAADLDRIARHAAELTNGKANVILAQSALVVAPLRRVGGTIPIVFVQVIDPVSSGFVASLARPGGTITGFADPEFTTSGKILEVLREVAPQTTRVLVIYNPVQAPQVGMWRAIETVAPVLGVQISAATPSDAAEIERTIEAFAHEPSSGVIVLPNPITNLHRNRIIALAARYGLPAVYSYPYFVRDGGLISYGADPAGQFRQAASYVDLILKGAKPADLPVQQPTKFDLVVNMKTAKALGLTIPQSILARADEVIE